MVRNASASAMRRPDSASRTLALEKQIKMNKAFKVAIFELFFILFLFIGGVSDAFLPMGWTELSKVVNFGGSTGSVTVTATTYFGYLGKLVLTKQSNLPREQEAWQAYESGEACLEQGGIGVFLGGDFFRMSILWFHGKKIFVTTESFEQIQQKIASPKTLR